MYSNIRYMREDKNLYRENAKQLSIYSKSVYTTCNVLIGRERRHLLQLYTRSDKAYLMRARSNRKYIVRVNI